MAIIDLASLAVPIDLTDPLLVNFTGATVATGPNWSWTSSAGHDLDLFGTALSFLKPGSSSNGSLTTPRGLALSGTISRVQIDLSNDDFGRPDLKIIGLNVAAPLLDQGADAFWNAALAGDDLFDASVMPRFVAITGGDDEIVAGGGDDLVSGDVLFSSAPDIIGGDDVVHGGAGKDRIFGELASSLFSGKLQGGNDDLFGDAGDAEVFGQSGDDELHGGPDNDRLNGGPGADRLFGEGGFDRLDGGVANDRLNGGEGRDFLTGRIGTDVFVCLGAFGRNVILDLENGVDRIDMAANLSFAALAIVRLDADKDEDRDDGASPSAIAGSRSSMSRQISSSRRIFCLRLEPDGSPVLDLPARRPGRLDLPDSKWMLEPICQTAHHPGRKAQEVRSVRAEPLASQCSWRA